MKTAPGAVNSAGAPSADPASDNSQNTQNLTPNEIRSWRGVV
jgi:hypothetical protein